MRASHVRSRLSNMNPFFNLRILDPGYRPWLMDVADRLSPLFKKVGLMLIRAGDVFMNRRPPETLYRLGRVVPISDKRPQVFANCFIAPNALVAGDVVVGRKSYIGYNAVVRCGAGERLTIGESANVQEKAIVLGNTLIGKWASVDAMAIVDNAEIHACSMVGPACVVMKGARIESNSMLCAASVLQSGACIPSGEIWAGNPAEKIGMLTAAEKEQVIAAAKHMVLLTVQHKDAWCLTWEEIENERLTREHWFQWGEGNYEMRIKPFYAKEPPRRTTRKKPNPMEGTEQRLDLGKEQILVVAGRNIA